VLFLGTAALALALTLDNLKLLAFERKFRKRERAVLIPSRG
jgi:hypothetical protein